MYFYQEPGILQQDVPVLLIVDQNIHVKYFFFLRDLLSIYHRFISQTLLIN